MVRWLTDPQRRTSRSIEIDRTPSQRMALLTLRPPSGGAISIRDGIGWSVEVIGSTMTSPERLRLKRSSRATHQATRKLPAEQCRSCCIRRGCPSFELLKRLRLNKAFAFDEDLARAGFELYGDAD
jgi:hypothetical protein